MLPVDELRLSGDERRLYDLIWKRTVATQMANARLRFTTATIAVEDALFRATGRTVLFAGFFRAYVEGSDDPEAALESQESPLPPLTIEEAVDCRNLEAVGHETKPPARYTEATLVKALEAEGIGRPSTYASIIDTILQRGYAFKLRRELVPTFTAFAVTKLLEDHFFDLVDLNFTANMEQKLDDIANGATDWLAYLRQFYLGQTGLESQVKEKEAGIDPRLASGVELEDLGVEVRIGQFGPFLAKELNGERLTAGIPSDLPPADLSGELAEQLFSQKTDGPTSLGIDPETERAVLLKIGPYGPYVQLGEEDQNGNKKPKRVSLLKNMDPSEVNLDVALQLLSLPRLLGEHPETGKPVQAGVGRFGPYIVHDGVYASLKKDDNVLEVDLDRALELVALSANRKGKQGGERTSKKNVLKELGEHPDGGPVQVLDGRYGPYVNYKKINVTLPKEMTPESVTLEQALAWVAAKGGTKGGATTKRSAKAASGAVKKSSTAKSSATKSSATKSSSAKKGVTQKGTTASKAKSSSAKKKA